MDADGRFIPVVDDDQGEGVKDFVEDLEEIKKQLEKLDRQEMDRMAQRRLFDYVAKRR